MSALAPRVAYFPDSFHEINGVAHTSRQFEAFTRRRSLPFLCVRAGNRKPRLLVEGQLQTLELRRGFLSFYLDKGLTFDPGFIRHLPLIVRTLKEFRPDIIHITGPSENGMLGAALANHLHLPLAASWHTNVHEYAARRSDRLLRYFQNGHDAAQAIERLALFASRLMLAHNRVLYPYHKWLLRTVAEVPDRPDDFVDLVRALAIERTPAAAEAVVMSLLLFREWPQAPAGWSTQFMLDSEWNWLDGEPPIDDL